MDPSSTVSGKQYLQNNSSGTDERNERNSRVRDLINLFSSVDPVPRRNDQEMDAKLTIYKSPFLEDFSDEEVKTEENESFSKSSADESASLIEECNEIQKRISAIAYDGGHFARNSPRLSTKRDQRPVEEYEEDHEAEGPGTSTEQKKDRPNETRRQNSDFSRTPVSTTYASTSVLPSEKNLKGMRTGTPERPYLLSSYRNSEKTQKKTAGLSRTKLNLIGISRMEKSGRIEFASSPVMEGDQVDKEKTIEDGEDLASSFLSPISRRRSASEPLHIKDAPNQKSFPPPLAEENSGSLDSEKIAYEPAPPRSSSFPVDSKEAEEKGNKVAALKNKLETLKSDLKMDIANKIRKLNRWHVALTLNLSENLLSSALKSDIEDLREKIDQYGKSLAHKLFSKFLRAIADHTTSPRKRYTMSLYAVFADIVAESPQALNWIHAFDPTFMNKFKTHFQRCFEDSVEYVINEYPEENKRQEKIVQMLIEGREACIALSLQANSSQSSHAGEWKRSQEHLIKKLSEQWGKQSTMEDPPLIISINSLIEDTCKEKKERERANLIRSLSLTLFNLRLETFLNLGEDGLQSLASSENVKTLLAPTISLSENLSKFVTFSILSKTDSKQRARLIKTFAATAHACFSIGDVESAAAVYRGLAHTTVSRLKDTYNNLSQKTLKSIKTLEELFSPQKNFGSYRKISQEGHPIIFPYLAVIFKDLEFAMTGNRGQAKQMWKKKIGQQLIAIAYHCQLQNLYQAATGKDIIPIPDLKTVLEEEKFIFTRNTSTLFTRSKQLEWHDKSKKT